MLLVRTKVKPSLIQGLGLFADQVILKDIVVWQYNPVFDISYDKSEINNLPLTVRRFLEEYSYRQDNKLVLCGDDARFMNHSDEPNIIDYTDGTSVAIRDIYVGEELTCNYYLFDDKAEDKLNAKLLHNLPRQ